MRLCFRPEQEGTWTWLLSPFLAFHFPLFVSICFFILPFLFFALLLIIVSEHGAPEKPEYKEKSRDKITKYLRWMCLMRINNNINNKNPKVNTYYIPGTVLKLFLHLIQRHSKYEGSVWLWSQTSWVGISTPSLTCCYLISSYGFCGGWNELMHEQGLAWSKHIINVRWYINMC